MNYRGDDEALPEWQPGSQCLPSEPVDDDDDAAGLAQLDSDFALYFLALPEAPPDEDSAADPTFDDLMQEAETISGADRVAAQARTQEPGPATALMLDAIARRRLSPTGLLDAACAAERLASWTQAVQHRYLAAFSRPGVCAAAEDLMEYASAPGQPMHRKAAGPANSSTGSTGLAGGEEDLSCSGAQVHGDPAISDALCLAAFKVAAAEVSAALRVSPISANRRVSQAVDFADDLPATLAALQRGVIDRGRSLVIAERTQNLPADLRLRVEAIVVPKAATRNAGQLRGIVDRAVIAADPAAAKKRQEVARHNRGVSLRASEDGMSVFRADLPADKACSAFTVIDQIAIIASRRAEERRTINALRADAFADIFDQLADHGSVHLHTILGKGHTNFDPRRPCPNHAEPAQPVAGAVNHPAGEPGSASVAVGEPQGGQPGSGVAVVGESLAGRPGSAAGAVGETHGGLPGSGVVVVGEPIAGRPGSRAVGVGESLARQHSSAEVAVEETAAEKARSAANNDVVDGIKAGRVIVPDNTFPADDESTALASVTSAADDTAGERCCDSAPDDHRRDGASDPAEPATPQPMPRLASRVPEENTARQVPGAEITNCLCHEPNTAPAASPIWGLGMHHGRATGLNVTIAATTLAGLDDLPGELDGHGTIPADLARALAASAATITAIAVNPSCGTALDLGRTAYRPRQAQRDYVNQRDQTCRFPSCRQPAWRCQLDHSDEFCPGKQNSGVTCPCNLACLCKFHHDLKTFGLWDTEHDSDHTITFTSPTGRTYTTQTREWLTGIAESPVVTAPVSTPGTRLQDTSGTIPLPGSDSTGTVGAGGGNEHLPDRSQGDEDDPPF